MDTLLSFIAPATAAKRSARREAAEFAATVTPGHTYYSIVDCNWPWGQGRLLYEWKAGRRRSWITHEVMFEHLSASGLWLGYGPIHAKRPGGILTFAEYRRRGDFPPDAARILRDAQLTPAGV